MIQNTAPLTGATMDKAVRKPVVSRPAFSRLSDGIKHPVTVTYIDHDARAKETLAAIEAQRIRLAGLRKTDIERAHEEALRMNEAHDEIVAIFATGSVPSAQYPGTLDDALVALRTKYERENFVAREQAISDSLMAEISGFFWEEVRLSSCAYGCKVYRDEASGTEVIGHHGVYGCPKAGTDEAL